MIAIKPYHKHSKSAKKLLQTLKLRGYNIELYNHNKWYDLVVNWGSTERNINTNIMINQPIKVSNSTNKLNFFEKLFEAGVQTPRVTTNRYEANSFNHPVFCRTNFQGGGRGLVVVRVGERLVNSDFYTEGVPCGRELRVHMSSSSGEQKLVCWSWKKPKLDFDTPQLVRNHKHGFYFSLRNNDNIPPLLLEACQKSIQALGLDFCCFDIIETPDKKYYFLESNTACGLTGTTLNQYTNTITNMINENLYSGEQQYL